MKPDTRVETGPVIFGNDWTGLFIRGDCAFAYARAIESALDDSEFFKGKFGYPTINSIDRAVLKGMIDLLNSTDERVKTDREVPVRYTMPERIE